MATGREQGGAAAFFSDVPAELAVPRSDAMVIIDLPVVDRPHHAFVEHGADALKVARPPAFKANAEVHAGLSHG